MIGLEKPNIGILYSNTINVHMWCGNLGSLIAGWIIFLSRILNVESYLELPTEAVDPVIAQTIDKMNLCVNKMRHIHIVPWLYDSFWM